MRCDCCPLRPIADDDVCLVSEGEFAATGTVRMCERNITALAERVENQAKLLKENTHDNSASKVQSHWRTIGNISGFVACDKCGYWCGTKSKYCPDCGAEMDGEEHDNNV